MGLNHQRKIKTIFGLILELSIYYIVMTLTYSLEWYFKFISIS